VINQRWLSQKIGPQLTASLKKFKELIVPKLSLRRIMKRLVLIRVNPLVKRISIDADFPSSAGSMRQQLELTLDGSLSTPGLLLRLSKLNSRALETQIVDIYEQFEETENSKALREILDKHGSDKGSYHNYDLVYAYLLNQSHTKPQNILEIGLGTNNTDTVSNMGKYGRPGASLRTWRDFLPEANIVGCDIDSRVLFQENRIRTYHLDQTNDDSWNTLMLELGEDKYDLVIDDGLHAPVANLRSIIYGLRLLKRNGVLVIEDAAVQSLPLWETALHLVSDSFSGYIVKTKKAYLVVFTKL
jgi:SAM-dependent methyltransferase